MRIHRVKPVKASDEMIDSNNKYSSAITNIRMAIDALGEIAKEDNLAKESIANLSVVLLDLSSDEEKKDEE